MEYDYLLDELKKVNKEPPIPKWLAFIIGFLALPLMIGMFALLVVLFFKYTVLMLSLVGIGVCTLCGLSVMDDLS